MDNELYTPPESDLDVPNPGGSELASRWLRLGGAIIDGLSTLPFMLPLMFFAGGFDGFETGEEPSLAFNLGMGLVGIILFVAIHGRFLLRDGQSLGKKVLKTRIVTVDDQKATSNHLMKRYGFYLIVPIIPILGGFINLVNCLSIFSASRRCLHDHVGGTKVIKIEQGQ